MIILQLHHTLLLPLPTVSPSSVFSGRATPLAIMIHLSARSHAIHITLSGGWDQNFPLLLPLLFAIYYQTSGKLPNFNLNF
jgi:hypothetical protein